MRERILFLPHRIPFPPDKGDKVRSYHILRHLAERADVWLGTFVDDPADRVHADYVRSKCRDACIVPLAPSRARLRALGGIALGLPMTVPYYADRRLRDWIQRTLERERIDRVLAFSSSMAQYAELAHAARREIDFVDIDSNKWAQYARHRRGPMAWLYRREARTLAQYECRIARSFDASYFVSEVEAAAFRLQCPAAADKVHALENGVDTEYFRPDAGSPISPFADGERPVVFTGAMDYWPNVDAVTWFVRAVLPLVREHDPRACFYIVGRHPTDAVRALAGSPGVVVTGGVPDVRPYLRHALVAVAPVRVARGVQNKVLEAMAMARPVVCSPSAFEGIRARAGRDLLVGSNAAELAALVIECLAGRHTGVGTAARARVERCYGWSARLAGLCTDHTAELAVPHAPAKESA